VQAVTASAFATSGGLVRGRYAKGVAEGTNSVRLDPADQADQAVSLPISAQTRQLSKSNAATLSASVTAVRPP
jgi:hypothetical protein